MLFGTCFLISQFQLLHSTTCISHWNVNFSEIKMPPNIIKVFFEIGWICWLYRAMHTLMIFLSVAILYGENGRWTRAHERYSNTMHIRWKWRVEWVQWFFFRPQYNRITWEIMDEWNKWMASNRRKKKKYQELNAKTNTTNCN